MAYPGVGPDLVAKSIKIEGLANIKIAGEAPKVISDEKGYIVNTRMIPNAWIGVAENWDVPLSLGGKIAAVDSSSKAPFKGLDFTLDQLLCFWDKTANNGKGAPVPPPPSLNLQTSKTHENGFSTTTSGVALLGLTDGDVEVMGTITVATPPAMTFDVTSVTLVGTKSTIPTISLDNLQYNSVGPNPFPNYIQNSKFFAVWTEFFQDLLGSSEAAKLITAKINGALLDPDNLKTISDLLETQISNALDKIFDSTVVADNSVTSGENAVDTYFFNRTRGALNDKSSSRYVPALILSSTSPKLDPFETKNLEISGSFSTSVLGQKVMISDIILSDLVVNGVSNTVALPQNVVFGANQEATATLLMGEVPPGTQVKVDGKKVTVPSPPLKASSPFTLNMQVNQNDPVPIKGTLTISVMNKSHTAGLKNVVTASGDDPSELQITFTEIVVQADPSDVTLGLDLPKDEEQYEIFLNQFLNQDALINAIMDAINGAIPNELDEISKSVTEFAKNTLNSIGT